MSSAAFRTVGEPSFALSWRQDADPGDNRRRPRNLRGVELSIRLLLKNIVAMTHGSVTCRRLRESGKPVTARMELAQPPGCRSCHDGNHEPGYGGDWENSRDIQGRTGFYDELNQLVALMLDVEQARRRACTVASN